MPIWGKDGIVAYWLMGASFARSIDNKLFYTIQTSIFWPFHLISIVIDLSRRKALWINGEKEWEEYEKARNSKQGGRYINLPSDLLEKKVIAREASIFHAWLRNVIYLVIGSALFFLLVYAENRIEL